MRTQKLIGSGALATALLIGVQTASADPDVFTINSLTQSSDGALLEDFTISAYAFGTEDYIDVDGDDGVPQTFHIIVNSGPSEMEGFDYQATFDYINYDIGFFLNGSGPGAHRLSLLGIKDPDDPNLIDEVMVKDFNGNPIGNISTDGSSIFFDATVEDILAGGEFVTIHWTQIPAPASLALFGLVGLSRRRRRD
jgi:hypothetical protein